MASAYSIYTQERAPTKRLAPRRRLPRWMTRGAAGALFVMLLVGLVHGWGVHRANQRRLALLAQLQQEQNPAKLREAIRAGQITRQDARQVFASRMQQRLQEYFKLPPGPQRMQYLDKQIDEFQARRAQFEARRQQRSSAQGPRNNAAAAGNGTPPAGNSRAARMESVPPENRAQMQQFRYDMSQRMQQRSIAPPFGR
jgi:hypothetical protein